MDTKMSTRRSKVKIPNTKSKSKVKTLPCCNNSSNGDDSIDSATESSTAHPKASGTNMDLKKEYARYCKLYSSEPLEYVLTPLEHATICQGPGQVSGIGGVSVNLCGCGLRGVDCIALGKILASNANIQQLNLSDSLLLPQSFQALLDGISKNTNLEDLELRGNNIQTANMLEPLAGMLKVNSNLKKLVLEWNHIGANKDAFKSFCEGVAINTGLEHVDLRNNQISDECALYIADAMQRHKTIKSLDLRWNSIGVKGARAFYELLNENTTLTQIHLGGNFVPAEVVQHIEQILKQRSDQEEIVKDYTTRTTILTRKLQRTEEEYQNEIKNFMSVFDAEEKENRRIIEESQNQINQITKERQAEIDKNSELQGEINKLQKQLVDATAEQSRLKNVITQKENRMKEIEASIWRLTGLLSSSDPSSAPATFPGISRRSSI